MEEQPHPPGDNTEGNAEAEERAIAMMLQYSVRGILYSRWYHRRVTMPESLQEPRSHVLVNCFDEASAALAVVPDGSPAGGRLRSCSSMRGTPGSP